MKLFTSLVGRRSSRSFAAGAILCWVMVGCNASSTEQEVDGRESAATARPLRLIVFDDPAMAKIIDREWAARGGATLTVENAESVSMQEKRRLKADAVIFPDILLGELVERRLIAPLSNQVMEDSLYERHDIMPMARLREGAWAGKQYALSFGSPQFTLYYRKDVFAALHLAPPTTWSEYSEVAQKLADRNLLKEAGISTPPEWSAVGEPWGEQWASRIYLTRVAAYAAHPRDFSCLFDLGSMEPRIEQPAFVRTLREMAQAAAVAPREALDWTPSDARAAIHSGLCGMALTWPSRSGGEQGDAAEMPAETTFDAREIGIIAAPGSEEVYNSGDAKWAKRQDSYVPLLGAAGRLGAVTRSSANRAAAENLLMWLSGPEMSVQIASSSPATTMFRRSHLADPATWGEPNLGAEACREYVELVERTQGSSVWLHTLRIPGAGEYLAVLDIEVRRALRSEATPEEALQATAQRWREITEKRGVEAQQRAYRHNFGLGG